MSGVSDWPVSAGAIVCLLGALFAQALAAGPSGGGQAAHSELVRPGADGKLIYSPTNEHGDTLPDFSNCGYQGGGVRLPDPSDVPAKVTLGPSPQPSPGIPGEGENARAKVSREPLAPSPGTPGEGGGEGQNAADDTARIQTAIDQVSKMPRDAKTGFRGAVLLKRGTYRINGQLKIAESGIVLRGEGDDENGTVLIAAGTTKRSLINVKGAGDPVEDEKSRTPITTSYDPVGARAFDVQDASAYRVGDLVIVRRTGNADWIHAIGMDQIKGRPGNENSTKQWQPFDLRFDRVITGIQGSRITIDAPITCAIDAKWGGGSMTKADEAGRIEQVGVEFLRGVSEFDASVTKSENDKPYASDENHATRFVAFDDVKNAWARNLTGVHFDHGGAVVNAGAKWVTVIDCRALAPVSVLTGGRRYPFSVGGGQLTLFVRCYAEHARHAFVFGSRVGGPNVFLDCKSERDHGSSEPHHRWSVGGLYDNVDANMAFQDRQYYGSGHGWSGANYVIWNCKGKLVVQQPPTAQNWAIGFVGTKGKGAFEPKPEGYIESFGQHVEPRSLYLQQLQDRLGKEAAENAVAKSHPEGKR